MTRPNVFTRRTMLAGAAAGLTAAATSSTVSAQTPGAPKTFVLVHGAWRGGWCWRRVADRLESRGHKVFTPTLTGLGDRSHLLDARVNLTTHINDIANLIKWERLNDIVLVGHSYGGFVVSGVAEKAGDRIASIVHADAFVPEDGESCADLVPRVSESIAKLSSKGEIAMPAAPASFYGVNEKDRAWVDEMCTPQPSAAFLEKITLSGARDRIARKTFIRGKGFVTPVFDTAQARAQAKSWRMHELPSGHDVMIDMPDQITEILLEAAPT